MDVIKTPKPVESESGNINFAIEIAFSTLIARARDRMPLNPVMGLMYLPDQAITRQFQEACRTVLDSLKPAADT